MADLDDTMAIVAGVGGSLIIILIVAFILAMIVGAFGGSGSGLYEATGDTVDIGADAETVDLWDSSGYAVAFDSGQGSVEIPADGGVGDGNTTAVVWARLDADALQSDNYHVANLGDGVASVQYRSGEWHAVVNRTDGGGVAEVTAPAPSPTDRTMVGIQTNGTHLGLVRDGQIRNATVFSTGNVSVPPARSWWGDQDELRAWSPALSEQQVGELENDPIGPIDPQNETLRLMLDGGSGSQTAVLVAGGDASLTGSTSWTDDGLEPTKFVAGEDYRHNEGSSIQIIDGSRLDGLRVAYVEYESWMTSLVGQMSAVMRFLVVMVLAVAALWLNEQFDAVGGGGR